MKNLQFSLCLLPALLLAAPALAHDTWVQPNANLVRSGDVMHVDLMLGNHGNHHRDFQLAGKVDPMHIRLELIAPGGERTDLEPHLRDLGTESNPAYWSVAVQTDRPGLYTVACLDDKVVHYAPARSIKSAKTFFVASETLDAVPPADTGFGEPLGHPLELVLKTDPAALAPSQPIQVQLLYEGQPLTEARVSFIPRGAKLQGEFDERYERRTDEEGVAMFEPTEATYHLIVAHHDAPEKGGDGYKSTKYSATVVLYVPAVRAGPGEQ